MVKYGAPEWIMSSRIETSCCGFDIRYMYTIPVAVSVALAEGIAVDCGGLEHIPKQARYIMDGKMMALWLLA